MKHILPAFQWMLFILTNSIVIPVAIANSFGFPTEELIAFVARTLFILGVAGLLQGLFGHRFPICEGPAGIWWGVFALYQGIGSVIFGSEHETLRVLEFCFILSGIIFILLSLLGWVDRLAKIFTPTVMGGYLVLIVMQLSGTFLSGMLGIHGDSPIDLTITLLSLATIAVAFITRQFRYFARYSTLISILFGWGLFIVLGRAEPVAQVEQYVQLPEVFAFGTPRLQFDMTINIILLTLLLLTNMIASVRAMEAIFKKHNLTRQASLRKTTFMAGIIHLLSGLFSAIGPVPISGSSAFVNQSRVFSKIPFIAGNLAIIVVSLSPKITSLFAALPPAVGYAALLPTFGFGIIVIAKEQLDQAKYPDIRNFAIAVAWFTGISIMSLSSSAFSGLPILVVSIFSNGVIVGTALAVCVEQTLLYKRRRNLLYQRHHPVIKASRE